MKDQGKKGATVDARPEAIGSVWWSALAMLAVCIPLGAIFKTASLPFLVIVAAIVATMYIWKGDQGKREAEEEKEVERLREKVKDLEERLANVEVINTFEAKLAEKEARRQHDAALDCGYAAAGAGRKIDAEGGEEV